MHRLSWSCRFRSLSRLEDHSHKEAFIKRRVRVYILHCGARLPGGRHVSQHTHENGSPKPSPSTSPVWPQKVKPGQEEAGVEELNTTRVYGYLMIGCVMPHDKCMQLQYHLGNIVRLIILSILSHYPSETPLSCVTCSPLVPHTPFLRLHF